MLDLLLTNARIVDGTGNPWRKGCVGVRDGRIVAVGSAHDMPEARTVLDIGGNILCPGFIDSHSHSDLRIIDEPLALPKIMQGITTENVGLDSMSVAPISDKNKEPWSTSISGLDGVAQKPWGWNGFASYLNALDAAKPSVNLSSYVGLGTVRLDVMGMEDRPPTAEELRLMEESVARCMEEGARGISAGLIYTPNKYQSTEELVALAKVAARYVGKSPEDAVLDLLIEENLAVGLLGHGMYEEDVMEGMKHPTMCLITDGLLSGGKPHPRTYAAFPRFIARYVREKRLLTLEEAVRKMTSSTALKLRMKRKGFIMPGMDADMVVFGENRIRDVNTFENPRVYPEGIDYVLVNGEIAVDHGVHTGARPGKTIRD